MNPRPLHKTLQLIKAALCVFMTICVYKFAVVVLIYVSYVITQRCSSARKKSTELRKAMEGVVVPMFCNTSLAAQEEQLNKLNKLLSLWESKNNYFDDGIIDKLKQPSASWSEYQSNLLAIHASAIASVTNSTKQTFDNYQAQHQAFVSHAMRQIQNIEQQKIAIEQQLKAPPPPPPPMVTKMFKILLLKFVKTIFLKISEVILMVLLRWIDLKSRTVKVMQSELPQKNSN